MTIAALVGILLILGAAVAAGRMLLKDPGRPARAALRRPRTWLVGAPALALIIGVGIPYVDAHVLAPPVPKPLSFADLKPQPEQAGGATGATAAGTGGPAAAAAGVTTTTTTAAAGPAVRSAAAGGPAQTLPALAAGGDTMAGNWTVGSGTEARYGVDDNSMGQTSHVVGRTHDVTGSAVIAGFSVTQARVVVNMQTVTCQCVHDAKYQQMLETSKYPTSQFVLGQPIALPDPVPGDQAMISVPVTGAFTIHGVTRTVTFTARAERIGPRFAIMATIPVKLSDYNIQSPSYGSMGSLSNCTIDFLVAFDHS